MAKGKKKAKNLATKVLVWIMLVAMVLSLLASIIFPLLG